MNDRVLIIDVETTGLDPKKDDITEIGCAVFSLKTKTVLWQYGTLIYRAGENPTADITGITGEMLEEMNGFPSSEDPVGPIAQIIEAGKVDFVIAHNAKFDRAFIEQKFGVMVNPKTGKALQWVCSREDIEYPSKSTSCRKLSHLALDLGIRVGELHRALSDVLLTCEVLKSVPDLEKQIQIALGPRGLFKAEVSFQRKDEAKSRGFSWNAEQKRWEKKLPIDVSLEPTEDRPFRLKRVA